MATGKITSNNKMTVKSVAHTKGSIVSASTLEYHYNPVTMDGFLVGRITTNGALSPNTGTNLLQITDSLRPYFPTGVYASATGIPVSLYNANQCRIHRGYYNSGRQLRYEDEHDVPGAAAFEIYVPVHLVQT